MDVKIMIDSDFNRVIKYKNHLFIRGSIYENRYTNKIFIIDLGQKIDSQHYGSVDCGMSYDEYKKGMLNFDINRVLEKREYVSEIIEEKKFCDNNNIDIYDLDLICRFLGVDPYKHIIILLKHYCYDSVYYKIRNNGTTVVLESDQPINIITSPLTLIKQCDTEIIKTRLSVLEPKHIKNLGEHLKTTYKMNHEANMVQIIDEKTYHQYFKYPCFTEYFPENQTMIHFSSLVEMNKFKIREAEFVIYNKDTFLYGQTYGHFHDSMINKGVKINKLND